MRGGRGEEGRENTGTQHTLLAYAFTTHPTSTCIHNTPLYTLVVTVLSHCTHVFSEQRRIDILTFYTSQITRNTLVAVNTAHNGREDGTHGIPVSPSSSCTVWWCLHGCHDNVPFKVNLVRAITVGYFDN